MDREIKFRWVGLNKHFNEIQINNDLTTKKLLEGSYLSFFAEGNRGETGNCKFLSEDLCTGIKDKNGKEVYEGDIVKCPVSINQHLHGKFTHRVVKWKQDSFTWVFDSDFSWGRFEDNLTHEGDYIKYTEDGVELLIEVVGNIYDNPNLIKQ